MFLNINSPDFVLYLNGNNLKKKRKQTRKFAHNFAVTISNITIPSFSAIFVLY